MGKRRKEKRQKRKGKREVGKKKTNTDIRKGGKKKSNLIPLSGCENVLVPDYKDKVVIHFREAKASAIYVESEA